MKDFQKVNPNPAHDDYDVFFERRCQAISPDLTKRMIYRDADDRGRKVRTDEYGDVGDLRDGNQCPA